MTICHDRSIDRLFVQASVREFNPRLAITAAPSASVSDAIFQMRENAIGSLLVTDIRGLQGIFTERDVLLRTYGKDLRAVPIETLMTKQPRSVPQKISVARIVYEMATIGCRHLVLHGGKELEVVSSTDVIEYLARVENGKVAMLDGPLREFLDSAIGDCTHGSLLTVSVNDTVEATWRLMIEHRRGCVAVVNDKGETVGIFSERDLVRNVLAPSKVPRLVPVREVMSHRPRSLPQTSSWALAIELMAEKHFRHIPVVDEDERSVGMVSVRDCFDRLAACILQSIT